MNTTRKPTTRSKLASGLFIPGLLIATAMLGPGGLPPAQAQTPPSCNQVLTPGCLYFPAVRYAVDRIESAVTYTDIVGLQRTVPIAIRLPIGAPAPMPVVIWSHGGAEGRTDPTTTMLEWSQTTAEAGYLTISLAHPPRSDLEIDRRPLCEAIAAAVPGNVWDLGNRATCEVFKHLNWDRPHDIRAVLDDLAVKNTQGPFQGLIDQDRIAVGGHSAGAGGALTVGGALRNFTGTPVDLSDPRRRPAAFLAFSPQAPGSEGFFDTAFGQPTHSWMRISRPVLIGTGDGDSTCDALEEPGSCFGDTPHGRRLAFDRLPSGDKYRIYIRDVDAFHGLFSLGTDNQKCGQPGLTQQKCDDIAHTLRSTALAFLDGVLRGDALALQWLQRGEVAAATGGVAEWTRK